MLTDRMPPSTVALPVKVFVPFKVVVLLPTLTSEMLALAGAAGVPPPMLPATVPAVFNWPTYNVAAKAPLFCTVVLAAVTRLPITWLLPITSRILGAPPRALLTFTVPL